MRPWRPSARSWASAHREYKVKDPRAVILQALVEEMFARFGHDELYDVAVAIEREAETRLGPKGIYPNVDFYSGLVYRKLGIPEGFVHAGVRHRTRGWLAEPIGGSSSGPIAFSDPLRSIRAPSHARGCP